MVAIPPTVKCACGRDLCIFLTKKSRCPECLRLVCIGTAALAPDGASEEVADTPQSRPWLRRISTILVGGAGGLVILAVIVGITQFPELS
jgi:hypothetical protein